MRVVSAAVVLVLLVALGAATYRFARGQLAESIYRERLLELGRDYESLRSQYNTAVAKTAVTELWVEDGVLSVVVVSAAGELRRVPTPYDPKGEIHVDFMVLEGRLWIRRIYDQQTAVKDALLVDPKLAAVDWDAEGAVYGLSVYRPLSEGRWVVSASGNGALSLTRRQDTGRPALAHAPEVQDPAAIEASVAQDLDAIGVGDVVGALGL